MTDGYWNSDVASTSGTSKGDDEDGETITGPNGESYRYIAADNKPESTCIPGTGKCVASTYYNSAANNTVADVAMYYWKTDLRKGSSALDNNVPTSDDDPAFWQHVSQYTIALGVSGNIPHTPENETLLKKGVTNTNLCTWDSERKCIWPTNIPESNKAGIDDLWHAAVNGHGKHFSAKSPTEFSAGLTAALADISKVSATAASETASSTVVKEGVYLYTPSFTSGSWSGNLKAYPIDDSGVISPIASWEAASKIPVASSRNIVTWNGTKGVNFTWTSTASVETITEAQKKVVGSEDVLNYLRGDDSKEKSRANGIYRDRTSRLGDIINSAPLYVKNGADQGYSSMTTAVTISVDDQTEDTTMGALYQIFKKSKAARAAMLYVGANDGMLHAFSAADGIERFAYVPASVLGNMSKLSDTNYTLNHKYYVDGQLTEGDAYLGEKWRTVLLGTTGAGAKSVFAMDITNPGASYSGLTKDNVMWEQSDTDDVDMGNVLGDARVAQLNNGEWVAIHGNGYRSSSGKAVLYVRKLSDGSVYRKVEVDTTTGNGLSTPALEYNSKNQVIGAYAGDIKGSLWKFDLQTPTAPTSTKLFTAESGQPIIQRPVYKGHPQGGNMVMFGTGKYFDVGDGDTTTLQSLYSVWDKPYSDVKQSDLQKQILTAVKKGGSGSDKDDIIGASVTPASTAPKSPKGCYVDLTLNSGERAIANPLILDRVLIFKTLVPAAGGCTFGGESYLYGLNFLSCGAGANPYFGLLNILKLTGGGAGGLQVVQKKDGTVQVWTKSFKENEKTQKSEPNLVSPGFRTWRQIPVNY